jgi:hypothetical protein
MSACPRRPTFAEGDALAHGDHVGRGGDAHHIAPLPRPGSGPCKHGRSRFPTPAHLVAWGERWPAPLDAAAAWRALAQDAPRASGAVAVRVGQPSICPVPRLRSARGAKKAMVAVAASLLTAIHVMLARGVAYRDLGATTSTASIRSAWPPALSETSSSSVTRSQSRQ